MGEKRQEQLALERALAIMYFYSGDHDAAVVELNRRLKELGQSEQQIQRKLSFSQQEIVLAHNRATGGGDGLSKIAEALAERWDMLSEERKRKVFEAQMVKEEESLQETLKFVQTERDSLASRLQTEREKQILTLQEMERRYDSRLKRVQRELRQARDAHTKAQAQLEADFGPTTADPEAIRELEAQHEEEMQELATRLDQGLDRQLRLQEELNSVRHEARKTESHNKSLEIQIEALQERQGVSSASILKMSADLEGALYGMRQHVEDITRTFDVQAVGNRSMLEEMRRRLEELQRRIEELQLLISKLRTRIKELVRALRAETDARKQEKSRLQLQKTRRELENAEKKLLKVQAERKLELAKYEQAKQYMESHARAMADASKALLAQLEDVEGRYSALKAEASVREEREFAEKSINTATTFAMRAPSTDGQGWTTGKKKLKKKSKGTLRKSQSAYGHVDDDQVVDNRPRWRHA